MWRRLDKIRQPTQRQVTKRVVTTVKISVNLVYTWQTIQLHLPVMRSRLKQFSLPELAIIICIKQIPFFSAFQKVLAQILTANGFYFTFNHHACR